MENKTSLLEALDLLEREGSLKPGAPAANIPPPSQTVNSPAGQTGGPNPVVKKPPQQQAGGPTTQQTQQQQQTTTTPQAPQKTAEEIRKETAEAAAAAEKARAEAAKKYAEELAAARTKALDNTRRALTVSEKAALDRLFRENTAWRGLADLMLRFNTGGMFGGSELTGRNYEGLDAPAGFKGGLFFDYEDKGAKLAKEEFKKAFEADPEKAKQDLFNFIDAMAQIRFGGADRAKTYRGALRSIVEDHAKMIKDGNLDEVAGRFGDALAKKMEELNKAAPFSASIERPTLDPYKYDIDRSLKDFKTNGGYTINDVVAAYHNQNIDFYAHKKGLPRARTWAEDGKIFMAQVDAATGLFTVQEATREEFDKIKARIAADFSDEALAKNPTRSVLAGEHLRKIANEPGMELLKFALSGVDQGSNCGAYGQYFILAIENAPGFESLFNDAKAKADRIMKPAVDLDKKSGPALPQARVSASGPELDANGEVKIDVKCAPGAAACEAAAGGTGGKKASYAPAEDTAYNDKRRSSHKGDGEKPPKKLSSKFEDAAVGKDAHWIPFGLGHKNGPGEHSQKKSPFRINPF